MQFHLSFFASKACEIPRSISRLYSQSRLFEILPKPWAKHQNTKFICRSTNGSAESIQRAFHHQRQKDPKSVNMRVTGHYSQGGRKYMEDKFSVAYQQTEDEKDLEYAYFGIFDGHGGSEAADYAKEHLMDSIVKQRQFWSDNDEDVLRAIRNGYMMTHMNMWKELDKWPKTVSGLPSTAGTTASVAFIRGGKIYIGHVGDSAIVLGYQVEGQEKWGAKPLTLDHKPNSVQEMNRIKSSGGKVIAKAGVHRVVWNRPAVGPGGSLRCDEIPFLAVARSLGDLWSYNPNTDEFVVSPDPDVGVVAIDPSKYRCLIFGTDGLWNMVSPESAVHLVQAAEKHNEKVPTGAPPPDAWLNPSKILVDSALEMWSNTKMRADNTSVVTLMMDPPGPPRNRGVHTTPQPHASTVSAASQPAAADKTETKTAATSPSSSIPDSPPHKREAIPSPTPSRSLSIVKRFPDQRPPPPPPISQPFTYTTVEEVEETFITNYGSPSDSYFIARLLNKTQIRNTLENVYEEISTVRVTPERDIIKANNNNVEEEKGVKTTILQRPSPLSMHNDDCPTRESLAPMSPVPPLEEYNPEEETDVTNALDSSTVVQENIQINEVSSSSPVDAPPKPKTRKSKTNAPSTESTPSCRSLRSHDTPLQPSQQRPHTRLANKGRHSLPAQPVSKTRNANCESKVPVAVPGPNSYSNNSSKPQVVIVSRPKLSLPSNKHDLTKNIAKVQKHVPVITKTKQAEPKTKPSQPPPDAMQQTSNSVRVTRSKDTTPSPADLLLKAVKDTALRKTQNPQQTQTNVKVEGECSKAKEERTTIITRQRNSTTAAPTPTAVPRIFLRRQPIEPENSKENLLTPSTHSASTVPLKSAKRRNSGGGSNDLEPKEKRRTRLDDKKRSDKIDEPYEDVTSSENNKDSSVMLGLSVASVVLECINDAPSKRSLRTVEETDAGKTSRLRNKKEKKLTGLEDCVAIEVHSTTVNLENEPLHSKNKPCSRSLRSKQDNIQEDDKRSLRSAERLPELSDKESRPILRSRNSVTGIGPKITPRRIRAPWNTTPRQSLRKRFSK